MKLTRAGFFKGLGALFFGGVAVKAATVKNLSVERISTGTINTAQLVHVADVHFSSRPFPRVILEGKDISNVCQRVEVYSDGTLRCWCFQQDAAGYIFFDPKTMGTTSPEICKEWRIGKGHLLYSKLPNGLLHFPVGFETASLEDAAAWDQKAIDDMVAEMHRVTARMFPEV